MNTNKNASFFTSIKFIFSFVKKYSFSLTIVIAVILLTTYLQVISPKIMGDAIDELVNYVSQAKVENLTNDIIDGKGLTEGQKDLIIENSDFTKEQEKQIKEATPKQLQDLYEFENIKSNIFEKNNTSILEGKGFSNVQKDYILNLDIKDEFKYFLLSLNEREVFETYMNSLNGLTKEEKNNISKMTYKQGIVLYEVNKVRQEAIKIDETAIQNEYGLTKKQEKFINESNIRTEEKEYILNQTTTELKQSYNSREIKIDPNAQFKAFTKVVLLLIFVYIFLSASMFLYNFVMAIIAGKSTRDMRKGLFGKIEKLSIRFFDSSNAGDLLSRFTNDIDNISNAMNQSVIQVVSQASMLVGILIMMFIEDNSKINVTLFGNTYVIHNVIVIVMLTFALVAILISLLLIKKARYYVSKQQSKLGSLNGYIDERISGQKVIISYGLEEETIEGFEEYNEDLKETSVKGQIYSGILMPFVQGVGLVNLGTLVFIGSLLVIDGTMTIGLLAAFIQYSQRFFNPLAQVVAQYNLLELASAGAKRVKEVYEVEPEIVNSKNAVDIDKIEGKVQLEHVNFGYDENKPVLKDINIEVSKGQMIALVGPTGSGKTTVMNLMNRFYDVNSGDIKFDGRSIKDITISTLRKNVGIVLQESIIFRGTIKYNIAYGNPKASFEEVVSAAKTANIHDFIMTLDNGYDTIVDNNTSIFSTGQKQLISIARTVLTDPDLIILDEATSNVDTVTEEKIQKAMENVLSGRTAFVIAHRLKTILNADKIIVLKNGEIIEQGTHKELLDLKGFYAELYNNQFVV